MAEQINNYGVVANIVSALGVPRGKIIASTFTHKNIVKIYKEFNLETVVKYDNLCKDIITTVNLALDCGIVSIKELSDIWYSDSSMCREDKWTSLYQILNRHSEYNRYDFINSRIYDKFYLIYMYIKRKESKNDRQRKIIAS